MTEMTYELGFIGGGNMAEAIVRAILDQKLIAPNRLFVCDPLPQRRDLFNQLAVATTDDAAQVVASAQQIMLAVKPQVFSDVGDALKQVDADRQIIASIMAGISTQKIEAAVGRPARVVRIMPNTPLMAGCGMSAIALGQHAQPGDETLTLKIFQAAGEAVVLDESHMDAVTAVSGSGPAYVFYLAEAMADAARSLDLPAEAVDLLTQQTVFGAAQLIKQSDDPPAELRRKVTSPGGTTQAAIEHMEAKDVRQAIAQAIARAAARSAELGR